MDASRPSNIWTADGHLQGLDNGRRSGPRETKNQCNINSLLNFVKLAKFGEFNRGPELDLVENRGQAGIVRTLAPAVDHFHQGPQFFARNGAEKQAVADIVEPLEHVGAVPQGAAAALGGVGDLLQRENGIDRRDGRRA